MAQSSRNNTLAGSPLLLQDLDDDAADYVISELAPKSISALALTNKRMQQHVDSYILKRSRGYSKLAFFSSMQDEDRMRTMRLKHAAETLYRTANHQLDVRPDIASIQFKLLSQLIEKYQYEPWTYFYFGMLHLRRLRKIKDIGFKKGFAYLVKAFQSGDVEAAIMLVETITGFSNKIFQKYCLVKKDIIKIEEILVPILYLLKENSKENMRAFTSYISLLVYLVNPIILLDATIFGDIVLSFEEAAKLIDYKKEKKFIEETIKHKAAKNDEFCDLQLGFYLADFNLHWLKKLQSASPSDALDVPSDEDSKHLFKTYEIGLLYSAISDIHSQRCFYDKDDETESTILINREVFFKIRELLEHIKKSKKILHLVEQLPFANIKFFASKFIEAITSTPYVRKKMFYTLGELSRALHDIFILPRKSIIPRIVTTYDRDYLPNKLMISPPLPERTEIVPTVDYELLFQKYFSDSNEITIKLARRFLLLEPIDSVQEALNLLAHLPLVLRDAFPFPVILYNISQYNLRLFLRDQSIKATESRSITSIPDEALDEASFVWWHFVAAYATFISNELPHKISTLFIESIRELNSPELRSYYYCALAILSHIGFPNTHFSLATCFSNSGRSAHALFAEFGKDDETFLYNLKTAISFFTQAKSLNPSVIQEFLTAGEKTGLLTEETKNFLSLNEFLTEKAANNEAVKKLHEHTTFHFQNEPLSKKSKALMEKVTEIEPNSTDAYGFIYQCFVDYSKSSAKTPLRAASARFLAGQWHAHYGEIIYNLISESPYKFNDKKSFQNFLKAFIYELQEKNIDPEKINPEGDVFAILTVVKKLTGIDFYEIVANNKSYLSVFPS